MTHPSLLLMRARGGCMCPDTFLSIAAMCYTGDAYLMAQALSLIETSMAAMRPNGQIPHNFVNNTPVFSAISGANQTGPNMFCA